MLLVTLAIKLKRMYIHTLPITKLDSMSLKCILPPKSSNTPRHNAMRIGPIRSDDSTICYSTGCIVKTAMSLLLIA